MLLLFESTSPVCVGGLVNGSVRCWRDNNARCARQCKQWQEAFRTGMQNRTNKPGNAHVGYEKRAFILLNGEEEVEGRISALLPSFFSQLHNVPVETKQRRKQTDDELPPLLRCQATVVNSAEAGFCPLAVNVVVRFCRCICKHTHVLCVLRRKYSAVEKCA